MTLPRVLWTARSSNKKLGPIPSCIVQDTTCSDSCPLKKNGCYAKVGGLGYHWRSLSHYTPSNEHYVTWDRMIYKIKQLQQGTVWRYAVAGDLPGAGDHIDREMGRLILANVGKLGFTYTHKPLTEINTGWIRMANHSDFAVNISAWDAKDADAKAALKAGPVVCLIPWGTPPVSKTPEGRTVIHCPAQRSDVTCKDCKLCADPKRESIIGFMPHGSGRPKADGTQNGGRSLNERLLSK